MLSLAMRQRLGLTVSGALSVGSVPMKAYCPRSQTGRPSSFLMTTGFGSAAIRPRLALSKSAVSLNGRPRLKSALTSIVKLVAGLGSALVGESGGASCAEADAG